MKLDELMKAIAKKDVPHFMIWFGDEYKIQDMYLDKIASLYQLKRTSIDDVRKTLNQSQSLFDMSKLYVITEDTHYQTMKENDWENIKSILQSGDNIVVLRYQSIKKNTKFYKKHDCVEFPHLSTDILRNYVNREVTLNDKCFHKLLDICENDYGQILLEIDKIKTFTEINKDYTDDEAFIELYKQGIIYNKIGDITFQLTDAVCKRDNKMAMRKLYEAKLKEEPAMMISSILYNNFRNMLAYQGLGKDKSNASSRTNLNGWQLKQCKDFNGNYTIKELQNNMILCQEVESGIKQGIIDQEIALEYLVLCCMKGG